MRVLEARAAAPSLEAKTLGARIDGVEAGQASFAKATALEAIDKRLAKLELTAVQPETFAAGGSASGARRSGQGFGSGERGGPGKRQSPRAGPGGRSGPRIAEIAADEVATRAPGSTSSKPRSATGRASSRPRSVAGSRKLETTLGDRVASRGASSDCSKTELRVLRQQRSRRRATPRRRRSPRSALEQRLRAGELFVAEWVVLSRWVLDGAALATLSDLCMR